ncbi:MAG: Lrp/AsnC family transcriptional regulator [Hyphomicrobiales bacterium]|nr:MAG: Lrp/AsnC family transcriptional regulator [Hyphomicrobiales bacterium]
MKADFPTIEVLCRWQRDFPLVPEPFAEIARALNSAEEDVRGAVSILLDTGVISRVGAVVRPNTAGASTLAAIKVPHSQLERVAALVSAQSGVNHNYEREHAFNLWFVATGADESSVRRIIERIQGLVHLEVLDLPLEHSYFIDLGFPLEVGTDWKLALAPRERAGRRVVDPIERRVLVALEHGLRLVPRPYAALGQEVDLEEADVISAVERLLQAGIITRFGLVVRHRALGYRANAMVVWDIADAHVDAVGARFAKAAPVTLCYRRPRRLPHWPYNLFCMVHGKERGSVLGSVEELARLAGPDARRHEVLFSRRCFKQRGASLTAA